MKCAALSSVIHRGMDWLDEAVSGAATCCCVDDVESTKSKRTARICCWRWTRISPATMSLGTTSIPCIQQWHKLTITYYYHHSAGAYRILVKHTLAKKINGLFPGHQKGEGREESFPRPLWHLGVPLSLKNIKYIKIHHFKKQTSTIFSRDGPHKNVFRGPIVAIDVPICFLAVQNSRCILIWPQLG